jgi:excisionase family DNA binding protein
MGNQNGQNNQSFFVIPAAIINLVIGELNRYGIVGQKIGLILSTNMKEIPPPGPGENNRGDKAEAPKASNDSKDAQPGEPIEEKSQGNAPAVTPEFEKIKGWVWGKMKATINDNVVLADKINVLEALLGDYQDDAIHLLKRIRKLEENQEIDKERLTKGTEAIEYLKGTIEAAIPAIENKMARVLRQKGVLAIDEDLARWKTNEAPNAIESLKETPDSVIKKLRELEVIGAFNDKKEEPEPLTEDRILTTQEAADRVGVTRRTINRWIRKGLAYTNDAAAGWKIKESDLIEWHNKNRKSKGKGKVSLLKFPAVAELVAELPAAILVNGK